MLTRLLLIPSHILKVSLLLLVQQELKVITLSQTLWQILLIPVFNHEMDLLEGLLMETNHLTEANGPVECTLD